MWPIKSFEDYEIGKEFISNSRTITETDITTFAHLTRDFHPIHIDAEYAKTSIFGGRIAHGLLTLSCALGMISDWEFRSRSGMAFLNLNWRFLKPVKINDTIHAKASILDKKNWKKPNRGIIVFGLEVINQKGEIVAEGKSEELVLKKEQV